MQTQATQTHYLKRAQQLSQSAALAANKSELNALEIAQWLVAKQVEYSKATWRHYKAALTYHFQQAALANPLLIAESEAAIELLTNTAPPAKRPHTHIPKTAAQKLKKLPISDLIKLVNYFDDKRNESKAAILWLLAGLSTGLRPGEWQHATLTDDSKLRVKNAKATNGRAHSAYRLIDLTELSKQDLRVIQMHLSNVEKANHSLSNDNSGFELFYHACRSHIYSATRKLWPRRQKHITLYSARHQFAANAKFNNLSLAHIAALMGHASIDTATHHYGRRSSGTSGFLVKANEDDVKQVVALNQGRGGMGLRLGR